MRIAFRADASRQIGSGHVMRCLTLANDLRERDCTCLFVYREHPGNLLELVRQQGFEAIGLPLCDAADSLSGKLPASRLAHADWLGANWQTDAEQTLAALGGEFVDWLVVDHYAIDSEWEQVVKSGCGRILVIDDLADRHHVCNLLLDQNLVAQMAERYRGKVPASCRQLLGPRFALLQPHYAVLHARAPSREGAVRSVFVYFGAADNANLTGKTISAFLSLDRKDVRLDVVINPEGMHTPAIREQVRGLAQVRLHSRLPSLAHLMMGADVAVGAGGATSWERCCLGLPSLIVTLAENQITIAAELHERGLARWLGHATEVGEDQLKQALSAELARDVDANWSARCHAAVDGRGVQRVAGAMLLPQAGKLSARGATLDDEAPCTELLVASSARGNFREQYRSWLRDPESYQPVIVESDSGYLVALAVFDLRRSTIRAAIAVDPFAQANGLRISALAAAMRELRNGKRGAIEFFGPAEDLTDPSLGSDGRGSDSRKLSISVCSDAGSWINESIPGLLLDWLAAGHRVSWANTADDLPGGDLCFFLSYGRIVGPVIRGRYRNCLVIHASDLPRGRGWSPASWLILEGVERIPVTLLEAVDQVDAGPIYSQEWLELDGTELIDDWHALLADATVRLAGDFVARYPDALRDAKDQSGEPSSYPRRRPKDSEVDPSRPLVEIFNQLRIADNDHYPVYFRHLNTEYCLRINRKT
ncbi:MAG: UDP-2,4-diacetamido-2,4,6-trideoxy-beta-L-altropyranose hydrolase [Gammaproteobacteria bacterium RIFOXYA12_FULL_61_12]|nr:MAG: UDP-2,4-diacetamido-2,4,6-trideoxy-beta-L-altropyranose hydrolase [Gammaproteobacteria bacterium RIFOXYD12_FULL_61_37]OGT94692.1 MAG: UDP-2,4-diacetamido-2,4,6-trideoxy-beta-L-altropyranose hydrolase [Gammaproteobacteria bacterium RIFOXYA12_FULL_61_12]